MGIDWYSLCHLQQIIPLLISGDQLPVGTYLLNSLLCVYFCGYLDEFRTTSAIYRVLIPCHHQLNSLSCGGIHVFAESKVLCQARVPKEK
jgi:hypothetical protein